MNGGRRRAGPGVTGSLLLTRREALRLGLAGGALACSRPGLPDGIEDARASEAAAGDEPVYELTPGDSLYDDFDGHGCFQTYEGRDLATAGALYERIWVQDGGSQVVDDPSGLASGPGPGPE